MKTPITLPCRTCTRCGRYKPVIAGCQGNGFNGRHGYAKPFVCAQCTAKRTAA